MNTLDRLYLSPEFFLIAVFICISLMFFILRVVELKRNANLNELLKELLKERSRKETPTIGEIYHSEERISIQEKTDDGLGIPEELVIEEINKDAHARLVLNNKHLEKNFSFLTLDTNTFKEIWDYFKKQNIKEVITFLEVILHFRPDSNIIRTNWMLGKF